MMPTEKDFATVQAQLAIRGHALTRDFNPITGRDDYTVTRWGLVRYLADWPAVLAFLKTVGGQT